MTNSANPTTASIEQITSWFSAITSHARRALFVSPHEEIPQKYVDDILAKGQKLALPWFAESTKTEAFHLPEAVIGYVDGLLAELQGWWIGLSSERRLQWAEVEHTPIPHYLLASYIPACSTSSTATMPSTQIPKWWISSPSLRRNVQSTTDYPSAKNKEPRIRHRIHTVRRSWRADFLFSPAYSERRNHAKHRLRLRSAVGVEQDFAPERSAGGALPQLIAADLAGTSELGVQHSDGAGCEFGQVVLTDQNDVTATELIYDRLLIAGRRGQRIDLIRICDRDLGERGCVAIDEHRATTPDLTTGNVCLDQGGRIVQPHTVMPGSNRRKFRRLSVPTGDHPHRRHRQTGQPHRRGHDHEAPQPDPGDVLPQHMHAVAGKQTHRGNREPGVMVVERRRSGEGCARASADHHTGSSHRGAGTRHRAAWISGSAAAATPTIPTTSHPRFGIRS